MSPLINCIAFAPLGVYLLVVGLINLAPRPFLVTGARDFTALAVALSGLVIVGPFDLFMPAAAAARFGAYAWVLLIALYILFMSLVVLYQRPRLTIYNITVAQLFPVLNEVASEMDPEATWAGHNLALPKLGVELHVNSFSPMQNVSLVSTSEFPNFTAWRQLEAALQARLSELRVSPNPRGITMVLLAGIISVLLIWNVSQDPHAIARELQDLLRM